MIAKFSSMKVAALAATFSVIAGYGIVSGGYLMNSVTDMLIGNWGKLTTQDCARFYPTLLELRDGGLYSAPGATQEGAHWHGGDWEIVSDGIFKIQMANDAMSTLELVDHNQDQFVLTDAAGCTVTYVRQE